MMGRAWMSLLQTFGHTISNAPLTLECSTPLCLPIVNLWPLATKKHEQEKRRRYDQHIREVEHGSLTPLVFNTMGGMGPTASVVFKRIASMIADKTSQSYTSTIQLIRCKLTFSLLRSTITCLRGSRSLSRNEHYLNPADTDLALVEGRVHL